MSKSAPASGTAPRLVAIKEKVIRGLSTRTTNEAELNPATACIGPLWQRFDAQVAVDYRGGNRVYGVYDEYASDENGSFRVLAGTDQPEVPATLSLETVRIPAGRYLVFSARGRVPDSVITAWQRIWTYFSGEKLAYQRLYTTDFEQYTGSDEIEIFIAVKEGVE